MTPDDSAPVITHALHDITLHGVPRRLRWDRTAMEMSRELTGGLRHPDTTTVSEKLQDIAILTYCGLYSWHKSQGEECPLGLDEVHWAVRSADIPEVGAIADALIRLMQVEIDFFAEA